MTNSWNIPNRLEEKIRKRDKNCIYCHVKFGNTTKNKATWEHIDNNENNISESNIALCCASCNASKGARLLVNWLNSNYCKRKNILYNSIHN